jgi:SSS family solute:Na+ symporter
VLSIFYTLLGVSLFVPILGGLYVPRATTREALAAIAAGVAAMLLVHVTTAGRGYGPLTPALAGMLAACAAFTIVLASRRGALTRTR